MDVHPWRARNRCMKKLNVFPDSTRLAHATADTFITFGVKAIAAHGRFVVALSGGSTPRKTYSLLASKEFAAKLAWEYVHIFWGDERCVSPDHPESNFKMARETLLNSIPLPADNIHRIRGESEPKKAARNYERELQSFFITHNKRRGIRPGEFTPSFDLILLDLGEDGHTASIFPGTAALRARRRWVVANHVEKLDVWRITLTPIIINAASNIFFLISGTKKAERLRQVLKGPYVPKALPAQLIRPYDGKIFWMVDEAAAAFL